MGGVVPKWGEKKKSERLIGKMLEREAGFRKGNQDGDSKMRN